MDLDNTTATDQQIAPREKTTPFLIRTFVKIGGFHRLNLFEDGTLPTTDEQQLFTWKDATLREVLTTLRNTAPLVAEYRHPLARFSFRTVYADSGNKGRFSQKDLGMVYSRDILGEPGSLNSTAPRLLEDIDGESREVTDREKEERTLDELRFVPGDYLLVAVLLPKNVTVPSEIPIKGASAGSGGTSAANGWRSGAGGIGGGRADGGWGGTVAPSSGSGAGRGGGHWRGESNAPPAGPRGRGGRGGGEFGRERDADRDRDRRVPPSRRGESPPSGRGGGRGGRGERRSRSRSRSPPRRRGRYD